MRVDFLDEIAEGLLFCLESCRQVSELVLVGESGSVEFLDLSDEKNDLEIRGVDWEKKEKSDRTDDEET